MRLRTSRKVPAAAACWRFLTLEFCLHRPTAAGSRGLALCPCSSAPEKRRYVLMFCSSTFILRGCLEEARARQTTRCFVAGGGAAAVFWERGQSPAPRACSWDRTDTPLCLSLSAPPDMAFAVRTVTP